MKPISRTKTALKSQIKEFTLKTSQTKKKDVVLILIKKEIDHHPLQEIETESFKNIGISVQTKLKASTHIYAIYAPLSTNTIKEKDLNKIFNSAPRVIAAGNYNKKDTHWNSRLCNKDCKDLLKYTE